MFTENKKTNGFIYLFKILLMLMIKTATIIHEIFLIL